MSLEKASKLITKHCESVGVEISYDADGAEIYWRTLRLSVGHKKLQDALLAISVLNDLGIQDA